VTNKSRTRLPGFTAEMALRRSAGQYRAFRRRGRTPSAAVTAQLVLRRTATSVLARGERAKAGVGVDGGMAMNAGQLTLGFSCNPLFCACSGDFDCNDMFSSGICGRAICIDDQCYCLRS
jgi:hypothetical protein